MLQYPQINPIAFSLGPLQVHWYGIMYLIGFALTWVLGVYRSKKPWARVKSEQIADAIFYGALGVILGGRTGYMLFYDFIPFIHQPWIYFEVWNGGMSFHGGLIGVVVAMLYYSHKIKLNLFDLTDFFVPMIPIGLGLGRIGNFINGELWGRVTNSPLGMVFPNGGPWPRYPSQLIEFSLEGVLLFIILWTISIKPRPRMLMSALFLIFYAIFRIIAECFRQPDPQLGFIAFGWLTMGQLLCLPMLLLGVGMLMYVILPRRKPQD